MSSIIRRDHLGVLGSETKAYLAKPEDTQAVLELLGSTAEWLKSTGSTQWSGLLQGEDSHNTPEAIKRGEVYIFMQGSMLAGMVMLMQRESAWDLELWGDEGHKSSIYLHRLNINRAAAGKNLGEQIVRWADSGIQFTGKDRIRLDCIANNPKLNDFYRRCGYVYKGLASNPLGDFNKYEKLISVK